MPKHFMYPYENIARLIEPANYISSLVNFNGVAEALDFQNKFERTDFSRLFLQLPDHQIMTGYHSSAAALSNSLTAMGQQFEMATRSFDTAGVGLNLGVGVQSLCNQMADLTREVAPYLQQWATLSSTIDWNSIQLGLNFSHQGFSQEWDTLVEELNDDPPEVVLDFFDDDEKQVAYAAVSEAVETQNWQVALWDKYLVFQKSNPIVARIILCIWTILLGLLINVASHYLLNTITKSAMKESPQAQSNTIIIIEQNQTVQVINSVPYYFEIEYTDPVTNKTYQGYISKRSVKQKMMSDEQESSEDTQPTVSVP